MPIVPTYTPPPDPTRRWLRPEHPIPLVVRLYLAATLATTVVETAVFWPRNGGIGLIAGDVVTLLIALAFIDALMRRSWKAWGALLFVQLFFVPFELNFGDPQLTVLLVGDAVKTALLLSPPMLRWIWKRPRE